jgi:hypothetical protein
MAIETLCKQPALKRPELAAYNERYTQVIRDPIHLVWMVNKMVWLATQQRTAEPGAVVGKFFLSRPI